MLKFKDIISKINRGFFLVSLILLIFYAFSVFSKVYAQSADQFSRSYITPFPKGNKYSIYVAGASLASGMSTGLKNAFSKDKNIEVKNIIKYRSGLITQRRFSWKKQLSSTAKEAKIDILVVFLGMNELGSVRSKKNNHQVGTEVWKNTLGRNIDELLKGFKNNKIAIYWVGLPIMRSPKLNAKIQTINEVFRKRTFINNVRFIDTWKSFADQFGRYSAFGPDLNGKIRRLREDNGINLSFRGNQKLAHFIEREIRRDMAIARAERNIPLAGTKEEQRRIVKNISQKPKIKKRYTSTKSKKNKSSEGESFFTKLTNNLIGKSSKKEKEENSNEVVLDDIKIVRPPISDIVLSGSVARNRLGTINALTGEIVARDINDGLTALASVTSSNNLSLKELKQRLPLKQTPYYRVLVKGERLEPKPGRADDFAWAKEVK